MNINQAKEYIKHSIQVYLKKDEYGDYKIPVVRQRPIFLLGAPGIGKTAIMEQIAQELGIALVSYSMTHHTRQSALGLPFIKQKEYDGKTYDVSEYTMSEIISSVYETMEESGVKEGILFLDEINCVSETLAPSMLQFLQYKIFGKHKVPEGWVVVTAGNPPQYNKSVREFDVVTMDRLKVLEVEADFETWKQYAKAKELHSAVISFLELKKEFFYHMETTVKGRAYVTARGWEDLSQIIKLYEEDGLTVDEDLIGQYLRSDNIVKEFSAYYDLYNKYKNDYKVNDILIGNISEESIEKAQKADFDERLSLLGLLLDQVQSSMKKVMETSDFLTQIMPTLRLLKDCEDIPAKIDEEVLAFEKKKNGLQAANALSDSQKLILKRSIHFLRETKKQLIYDKEENDTEFAYVKSKFDAMVMDMKQRVETLTDTLHYVFEFCSKAFDEGNEMLILVTELTVSDESSRYIAMFGCEDYHKYNKLLMISERQSEMKESIEKLDLML